MTLQSLGREESRKKECHKISRMYALKSPSLFCNLAREASFKVDHVLSKVQTEKQCPLFRWPLSSHIRMQIV